MREPGSRYPRALEPAMPARPVLEDVTVVIPTLGRAILETCLFYLADGTAWPRAIVVVDQGRNTAVSGMLALLERIGVGAVYVPSGQKGRAAGINRGLERVSTRFVAITDDDCFVSTSWLEKMRDHLEKEPGTIVTGRVELAGKEEAPFSTVTSTRGRRYTKPQLKVHPFIGGNVGLAMDIVERIGPFDEHPCLASAEDSDYGYRALRLGIPIAYDPGIVLFHFHWRDARERAQRYGDYARSQGGFYGTHLRHGDPLILMQAVRDTIRSPLRWARGLLSGDKELADNGRESTLNLLPGIIAGLRRGRSRQYRQPNT
jgi:GT2 family glycosyltransferase